MFLESLFFLVVRIGKAGQLQICNKSANNKEEKIPYLPTLFFHLKGDWIYFIVKKQHQSSCFSHKKMLKLKIWTLQIDQKILLLNHGSTHSCVYFFRTSEQAIQYTVHNWLTEWSQWETWKAWFAFSWYHLCVCNFTLLSLVGKMHDAKTIN